MPQNNSSSNRFFEFVEETHTYRLEGVALPSVTAIMNPLNDFSFVTPEYLEVKRALGVIVHKTICLYVTGKLTGSESSLSDGNKLALDLFSEWYASKQTKEELGDLYFAETPVYHKDKLYATTPDLVFENGIVEIKTRYPDFKKDSIQTAAQSAAVRSLMPETLGKTIKKNFVLGFNFKDKKLRFSDVTSVDGETIFDKLHERYKREVEFNEFLTQIKKRTKNECKPID